jgi:hypothetical protein
MPARGKRPAQAVVDLTRDGQENAHRPTKIGRSSQTNSSVPLANVTNGQRFGQDIDYISLSQLDDDDFNSIVPATQGGDDLDLNSYQLYGNIPITAIFKCLYVNVARLSQYKNRGSQVLHWIRFIRRTRYASEGAVQPIR